MLRIIAGKYRSRLILQPSAKTTRPTVDRAREAIFSSIQFDIENKRFLDLFSGSGSFCLEALSRNALNAVAIEKDSEVFKILNQNKALLKDKNLQTYNIDAISYLNNCNEKFDYIYLDPPYKISDILSECLILIKDRNILNANGTILIETNLATLDFFALGYETFKLKKYGKIYIYYLRYVNI